MTSSIAEYVRNWGSSTSIALLDPACTIFSHANGIIGFRPILDCAVVLGEPLCSSANLFELVKAFYTFCNEKKLNIIYTVTSKQFMTWAAENHFCNAYIQVGEELVLNPQFDPQAGAKGRKLRSKVNQALNANVTIHEYIQENTHIEKAIEQLAESWLKSRQGFQIYLANVHLFDHRPGKRWFYAQQGEKIIGVLLLNKLDAHRGWLFNLLLCDPSAPHGTSEALAETTIQKLRQEGCTFVSFGTTAGENIGTSKGLSKFSIWIARNAFFISKKIFPLDARKIFWEKFHPRSEPTYLLFSNSKIRLRDIYGIMHALNVS